MLYYSWRITNFAKVTCNSTMEKKRWELKKLLEAVERELSWKPLKPLALSKVRNYLRGIEKPKKSTLDKISLFVGFQDWDSFQEALHGEADATTNYKGSEKVAKPDTDSSKDSSQPAPDEGET